MSTIIFKNRTMFFIRLALLFSGVVMMTLGLVQGEAQEVLSKAIIICLECIGIG